MFACAVQEAMAGRYLRASWSLGLFEGAFWLNERMRKGSHSAETGQVKQPAKKVAGLLRQL